MLVDAGADLLAKDALGLTPLDLADKADHTETMAVLRGAVDRQEQEKQRDFYSLLDACAGGDLATVKTILGAENHPSDLVNFEEGFGGVVNYNYHSGICVAKLHLPYGYATQLRFNTMQQNMLALLSEEASPRSAVTSIDGKTGLLVLCALIL